MQKFICAVGHAFHGVRSAFRKERNFRIQVIAGIIAITAGFLLHVPQQQHLILLLCTTLVLSLEMINTAVEQLCNHLHPAIHEKIRIVKDLSAGAVLFAAVVSLSCGLWILLPPLLSWIQNVCI